MRATGARPPDFSPPGAKRETPRRAGAICSLGRSSCSAGSEGLGAAKDAARAAAVGVSGHWLPAAPPRPRPAGRSAGPYCAPERGCGTMAAPPSPPGPARGKAGKRAGPPAGGGGSVWSRPAPRTPGRIGLRSARTAAAGGGARASGFAELPSVGLCLISTGFRFCILDRTVTEGLLRS